MPYHRCKICGWTQARKTETIAHVTNQHPPESLVEESDTL